jgi:hypothetical protein
MEYWSDGKNSVNLIKKTTLALCEARINSNLTIPNIQKSVRLMFLI